MKYLLLLLLIVSVSRAQEIPYSQLKQTLAGQGDVLRRSFKRLGDKTITFEALASIDGQIDLVAPILTELKNYGNWALQNINVGPEGKKYFLQFLGFDWKPETPNQIGVLFVINLPIFKHEGTRQFTVSHQSEKKHFHLTVNTLPEPNSVIESCEGTLDVYPAENENERLWVGLKGTIKLRNWLLYEALPEKLIANEAGDRILTVLNNYQKEELKKMGQSPKDQPIIK